MAGVKTTHVWDGQDMVAELNGSNAMTAIYARGGGGQIISALDSSNAMSYYLYNGHGDVTGLTNASGALGCDYGDIMECVPDYSGKDEDITDA